MASETKIYGASDDLIELEGRIVEEFSHYGSGDDSEPAILAFSDGTLLEIEYDDDGIWRIKRLAAGACEYAHTPGDAEKDTPDEAILRGEIRWCVKSERGQYSPAFAGAAATSSAGSPHGE